MQTARTNRLLFGLMMGVCLATAGCRHSRAAYLEGPVDVPRENRVASIREYYINPPDVLVIDLVRAVPLPPYKIKAQDLLFVNVKGTPPEDPIKGVYRVEPEGNIRFGPIYGSVSVAELTIDQATSEIEKALKKAGLKEPQVAVTLEETRGIQLVRGEHLVRPDGTVNLGLYGRVPVAGMTQEQAKGAIEHHLSKFFLDPLITIDVAGFNSSVYYIIFDGGGSGEQVVRLPITGRETVLDAIGQVAGLPAMASKSRVWLARPEEKDCGGAVLPIDWCGITQQARTGTNYQLYPGDRIYVEAQPLVTIDTRLGRLLSPVERVFGVVLLGSQTVRSFRNNPNGFNSGFGF
jgi:polysaccharide export outer membrane protein